MQAAEHPLRARQRFRPKSERWSHKASLQSRTPSDDHAQSYAGICGVYFPRNRDPLCDRAGTTGSTVRVSTRARNCSPQPWRDLSEPSSSVRWVSYSSLRASSSSVKRAPSSPPAWETCTPERANREPFLWRSSGRSDTRSAPPRETAAAGVFVPAAAVVSTRYPQSKWTRFFSM